MCSHIAAGLEYIGQCALCGIYASSTPLALSFGRYDREEFCSPYISMSGAHGRHDLALLCV